MSPISATRRRFADSSGGVFETPEFIASLERFVEPLILPGRINSLAQTLIKMVAPGVPDFYQGTELWDLSLVDPDNRRPVDFALRAQLLEAHAAAARRRGAGRLGIGAAETVDDRARAARSPRARRGFFRGKAKYQPLVAQGSHLGRLLAFRRGENLIAVVPRFTMTLAGDWGDTRLPLPGGSWRNCFTGRTRAARGLSGRVVRILSRGIVDPRVRVIFAVWAPGPIDEAAQWLTFVHNDQALMAEAMPPENDVSLHRGLKSK